MIESHKRIFEFYDAETKKPIETKDGLTKKVVISGEGQISEAHKEAMLADSLLEAVQAATSTAITTLLPEGIVGKIFREGEGEIEVGGVRFLVKEDLAKVIPRQ